MNKGLVAFGLLAGLLLAGCSSTRVAVNNAGNTEQLGAVQTGSVSKTALPPIGANGEVQTPEQLAAANGLPGANGDVINGDGTFTTAEAGGTGSFESLPPVGALPNSSGRDLSGGLTVEKLLGRWTVVSGGNQCQLNLTQTAKTGTGRYRASAPACGLKGLSVVSSWTLAGTQVQLFDENGDLVAALILSGNRFIGTIAGGTGISMVG